MMAQPTQPARKIRIAVVNSHPIQYFAPLYAYLNASGCFEVSALYCSDYSLRGGADAGFGRPVKWDIDLLSGYRAVFLGKRATQRVPAGFFSLIAPEIWSEVRSGRYDALWLHGHNYAANLLALLAAKSRGLPVMMRGETHLNLRRTGLRRALRKLLMRPFYALCDRFLAIGTFNMQFYLATGVPEGKIFRVPYSVDNARFMRAARLTEEDKADVRRSLGAPLDRPLVLYASKFMARKRPQDLLRAAAALNTKGLKFTLMMVGTGELENELKAFAAELGLASAVFPGFLNQSELPRVYAASDVFVLPSEDEPWGLVVNEVMCAGIPIVVADEIGCAVDLIVDGHTGYRYRTGNVEELAARLEALLRDEVLRRDMGRAALDHISRWGYRECCDGLLAATRDFARAT